MSLNQMNSEKCARPKGNFLSGLYGCTDLTKEKTLGESINYPCQRLNRGKEVVWIQERACPKLVHCFSSSSTELGYSDKACYLIYICR
ncbi:hypothetical protein CUMW_282360 [Citrus unshiu]|uniref:Uncharacterized protein n=1 Tax=Citrus unshiu TaxID=55188 RepID=A0A2H5N1R6_CITUN|nr:hypothetical protein CUMW_282360 [Citrus unshiu]